MIILFFKSSSVSQSIKMSGWSFDALYNAADARTPPTTPRASDQRYVVVFDVDGTLTPHPGGHPDSLFNRFMAYIRENTLASELALPAQAMLMNDAQRHQVAAAYTAAHISEIEQQRIKALFTSLHANGIRVLLASHNFSDIVRPYLALFGLPDGVIDWSGSIFTDGDKVDPLVAPTGPLDATPAVIYVDDDQHQIARFRVAWGELEATRPKRPCVVYHIGDHWLGRNDAAFRFLSRLTASFFVENTGDL